jgi:hypothetical protein
MAKQVAVARVYDQGMTGQATPGSHVNRHAWMTGSNLQGLMRSQVKHALCDGVQDEASVLIAGIIESIGLPGGGSALAHPVPFLFAGSIGSGL